MSKAERVVGLTHQLYELRRTARMLRGGQYPDDMVLFKKAILQHAGKHSIEVLPAAIQLGKNAQANGSEIAFMLVMAAAVELSEEA